MREAMKLVTFAMVLLVNGVMVKSSQDVMKSMTKNFLKAYEACAKEYTLPESTANELINFWKEDFSTTNRNVGCAILCLTSKLSLLDPEGKLHHGKAEDFAKQHGADGDTAKKLVEILHTCEKNEPVIEDHCTMALGIAMCFKKEMHNLKWAPDSELLFDELVADMQG
ncbi:hypothetical protein ACJJTC_019438 [Scirpophaga incertulas]